MKKVALLATGFILTAASLAVPASAPAQTPARITATHRSWPKSVVYVQDNTVGLKTRTGAQRWPVKWAAERWDNDSALNFVYTTKGCPKGSQCVAVGEGALDKAVGVAVTSFTGDTIVSSRVILNHTWGKTAKYGNRRNVVCHELGHAIGLEHSTDKRSCMYPTNTENTWPDAVNYSTLRATYGAE